MFGQRSAVPPFVGRRFELMSLDAARLEAAKRHGSVLLIGGEAGIGKSRLLEQLVPAARPRRMAVVTAECRERAQQPLGPLRTFVRALYGLVDPASLTPTVVRAVAQLTPELVPENGAQRRGTPPLEKAELFEAIAALLLLVESTRMLILTIEDVHWADASTLDFLVYFAPRIANARIVVGATYRTEDLEPGGTLSQAVAELMRCPTVRAVALAPLSPEDVRALVTGGMTERLAPPSALVRDIESRCDGNPFFAEELLKAALSAGSAGVAAELPLTIRASILQRLQVLDAAERSVLAQAAVLGYRFDPDVLSLVLARPLDELVPLLRRFRDLGIIVEEPADRVRCRFKHALTRHAIYDDMLAFDARRLHQRILATLEALAAGDRHLDELAYHAWESKDAARTLRYNERAGAAALAVHAGAEARLCYERALSAASDDADIARLLERAGTAAQLQGRLEEAVAIFHDAIAIFLRLGDVDRATHLFVTSLAERYNRGILGSTIVRDAETFLAAHERDMSTPVRDDLLVFAARIAAACYGFDDADRLLASVSPPERLVPLCRHNFYLATHIGQAYRAETEAWRRSVASLREVFPELSPRIVMVSLFSVAKAGTFLGANDVVEAAFSEALAIERIFDFPGLTSYGWALRATYAYVRGRLTEARAALERALERTELFAARVTVAEIAPLLGLALDDPALASRGVDAVGPYDPGDLDLTSALMFAGRGAAHVAHGRGREAAAEMRRALDGLTLPIPAAGFMLPSIAQYLPEIDLPRLLVLVRGTFAPADLGRSAGAAMVEAIVARRLGSNSEATAFAETAAALYVMLDWPLYVAAAFEVLGRSDDALEIYHRCGALKDVRRLANRGSVGTRKRDVLSAREREIAELVAAGMTNAAIAERLHLSPKTVEKYLSSVFVKLSVRSRSQLAGVIARTAISA